MKKILHVVNVYFVIPYFLGEQLIYFSKKGYKEHIICSPSAEISNYAKSHCFDYKEVSILRKISIWSDLKALFEVLNYIHKQNIDIVVGHTPKGGVIAMLASFLKCVPIRIYFRHGLVYETARGLKRMLLVGMDRLAALLATKVVCVSPSVYKKSIDDRLNTVTKQVILNKGTCNGIDTNRFDREKIDLDLLEKLEIKYDISHDDFVIGYVGRLVRDKGILELVDSFCEIQNLYTNVKLLIVGMFECRDSLPADCVSRIENNPSIICTGYVNNQEIEHYYCLMDIFVLLSYREGYPTSVLEASSMSLPVITTRATGCIDAIVNGKTGEFVSYEHHEIVTAIRSYIDNPEKCRSHGQLGRQFVESNFKQLQIWDEIEKLYQ